MRESIPIVVVALAYGVFCSCLFSMGIQSTTSIKKSLVGTIALWMRLIWRCSQDQKLKANSLHDVWCIKSSFTTRWKFSLWKFPLQSCVEISIKKYSFYNWAITFHLWIFLYTVRWNFRYGNSFCWLTMLPDNFAWWCSSTTLLDSAAR